MTEPWPVIRHRVYYATLDACWSQRQFCWVDLYDADGWPCKRRLFT